MTNLANMSPAALAAWRALKEKYPDLSVSSAYRDAATNKRVRGANKSQHLSGNAFDVPVPGMPNEERGQLIQDAYAAGFNGVGVYNNSLHFDVGPPRAWGPSYLSDSIPDWAKPYLTGGSGAVAPSSSAPSSSPPTLAPPTMPDQPPQQEKSGILDFLEPENLDINDRIALLGGLLQQQPQQAPAPPPQIAAPVVQPTRSQYPDLIAQLLRGIQ